MLRYQVQYLLQDSKRRYFVCLALTQCVDNDSPNVDGGTGRVLITSPQRVAHAPPRRSVCACDREGAGGRVKRPPRRCSSAASSWLPTTTRRCGFPSATSATAACTGVSSIHYHVSTCADARPLIQWSDLDCFENQNIRDVIVRMSSLLDQNYPRDYFRESENPIE